MLWDYLKKTVVTKYMLFGLLGCLGNPVQLVKQL